jgi:hypothetical protein
MFVVVTMAALSVFGAREYRERKRLEAELDSEHRRAQKLEAERAHYFNKWSGFVENSRNERAKSANEMPFLSPKESTVPMPNLRPRSTH